jgi:asparaginyl-tRNA synthetase
MFRVTTLPLDDVKSIPVTESGSANFTQDFFSKPAYLTVSGQLSGETYACALGDIYTFGPTFRAENSQTTRHLAEFHMIEPEMAFADLDAVMDNAERFVKHVVKYAIDTCPNDLNFFEKFVDASVQTRLAKLVNEPFVKLPYKEAVKLLQEEIAKNVSKWQFPIVEFGTDLSTEHERWLAEEKFKACVFVHNYPRKIKAFYMRDNTDGDTVDSFDLLVPGIGELIGGSQREERLAVLEDKIREFGLVPADYWWYLDLRRYGSVPHSGYGLGFERLVCYVTGIENIREAIAYPRYPGNAEF